jgi:hypothetical protein
MSRNRYTRTIHEEEAARIARRENDLDAFEREFRQLGAETVVPEPLDEAKTRRQVRLGHNKRHKSKHPRTTSSNQS